MTQFKRILTSVNLAFLVAALIFILHGSSPTNADSRGWTINWNGVKAPFRFEGVCRPSELASWSVGARGGSGNVFYRHIEIISSDLEILDIDRFLLPNEENSVDLYGVYFDTSGRGWVVGEKGSIFHTPDNGRTWIAQESGTKEILEDIVCVSERSCWILGGERVYSQGFVLRTTDGGSTWQKIAKVVGRMIDFVDEKHGWIVDENLIYRTTNGGRKWTKVRIVPDADDEGRFKGRERDSVHFSTIRFVTPEVGWAAGGNMVARTDNGGKTWKISELDVWSEASIAGIVAHDNKTAMAVNKGEWNYCTEDAGKTWAKCFRRKDIPQADKTDQ
jgi:photosystem II stability/assembly factor-like uncharacterized protein